MSSFFEFEREFIESLHCIPMIVRMKLDTCGVKLKLVHWNQLTSEERQGLMNQPCATPSEVQQYREDLQGLIVEKTGSPAKELAINPHPPWLNSEAIPAQVQEKAQEFKMTLSLEQWQNLNPFQRFALIKLSRSSHENKNFLPALKEFKIIA